MMVSHRLSHEFPLAAPSAPRARIQRFVAVGVLNTGFGYGVYALAVWLGAAPHLALIAQFSLGILWNYMTHARLVFGVRGTRRLPFYALAYLVVYVLNVGLLTLLLALGANAYLAQALALPFIVVLSYVLVSMALQVPLRAGDGDPA